MKKLFCFLLIFFLFAFVESTFASEDISITQKQLLQETEQLLKAVEENILSDLDREEEEAESENSKKIEKSAGDALTEEKLRAEREAVELQRKLLLKKVVEWRQHSYSIDLLTAKELNEAMAKARSIAGYYGLDVEKLGKLYELGKKTIRNSEFVVTDRIPPDKDESYSTYFRNFFIYAHEREKSLSEFRAKTQEYRVRLFKRVTLAYMSALLSSGENFPKCNTNGTKVSIHVNGTTIQSLGCPDPVIDNLRRYVKAVQLIASAESDTFTAEAELVIAGQTLIGDIAAGIPLVGDAIDFYSLYSGEDLAGQCLSRFSYGVTAVFSAIPFVPSSWMDQILKRSGEIVTSVGGRALEAGGNFLKRNPGVDEGLSRLLLWASDSAGWSAGMVQGFAVRVGVTPGRLDKAARIITSEVNLTRSGVELKLGPSARGKITKSSQARVARNLSPEEIVYRNVKIAEEGQLVMRNLPKGLRERMEQTSRRIMSANLDVLQGSRKHIVDVSNMVPEHLAEFEKLARSQDAILAFRAVNSDATNLIKANYGTKWMDVKPKSADWGPHRGFLPFDQNFSKIKNPAGLADATADEIAKATAKAEKYSGLARECLSKKNCFKIDLELPDGNTVHIWKRGNDEIPVLKNKAGQYLDPDTKKVLDVSDGATRPMEVMAGKNAKGEIVPLTADYDLLAMGTRSDARAPKYSDETGYISAEEEMLVGEINEAGKRAGYTGGNLSHHGPENQFFASPGALAEDPVMTIIDPQKGLITVPRCDVDCMKQWCKTSRQCGGIPICRKGSEAPPCLPIDPDRLLKDYFHDARLRGYSNLRPNSVWGWGEVNGLSGWTPKVLLDNSGDDIARWTFGQYRPGQGVVDTIRKIDFQGLGMSAKRTAIQASKYLFSCPGGQN